MMLSEAEVARLRSLGDPFDAAEVEDIYLPLSRLLSLHIAAAADLSRNRKRFLGGGDAPVPYVIGLGGSVAAGKSTTARVLQALLARSPTTPRIDLVTTDGFLRPNTELERRGLLRRKGFPESYDLPALLRFLSDVKGGQPRIRAPVYSHLSYDVLPSDGVIVDRPDILILEGINVLHVGDPPRDGRTLPFVSDHLNFSLFLDAEEVDLRRWYIARFLALRGRPSGTRGPTFTVTLGSDEEAVTTATGLWKGINLVNLRENILPTRRRADATLRKGAGHCIEEIALRRM